MVVLEVTPLPTEGWARQFLLFQVIRFNRRCRIRVEVRINQHPCSITVDYLESGNPKKTQFCCHGLSSHLEYNVLIIRLLATSCSLGTKWNECFETKLQATSASQGQSQPSLIHFKFEAKNQNQNRKARSKVDQGL